MFKLSLVTFMLWASIFGAAFMGHFAEGSGAADRAANMASEAQPHFQLFASGHKALD